MHTRISLNHVGSLSTVAFGAALATTVRTKHVCPVTFLMLEAVVEWLYLCYQWIVPCLVKVNVTNYVNQNEMQLQNCMQNNQVRLFPGEPSRQSRCALVAIGGGICSALSVGMGPFFGVSDAHVMSVVSLALARNRAEKIVATILTVAIWFSQSLPCAHGILRSICILVGFVLRAAFLPAAWKLVRFLASFVTIFMFSPVGSTVWGGVSPVTMLSVASYIMFLNPLRILSFCLLLLLL